MVQVNDLAPGHDDVYGGLFWVSARLRRNVKRRDLHSEKDASDIWGPILDVQKYVLQDYRSDRRLANSRGLIEADGAWYIFAHGVNRSAGLIDGDVERLRRLSLGCVWGRGCIRFNRARTKGP